MAKIVIQVEHSDLVRLLGGDEAAQVEFRRGIIETFAKEYIKPLINSEALQAIAKQSRDEVRKEIFADPGAWRPEIDPETRRTIDRTARAGIERITHDTLEASAREISELLQANYDGLLEQAKGIVERLVNDRFEETVNEEVTRRINAVAKAVNALDKEDTRGL